MDARGAFHATLKRLEDHPSSYSALGVHDSDPCSLVHLRDMRKRLDAGEDYAYGKICRWLGYIQGVAVARGLLTLDEVKKINWEHSDDKNAG